MADPGAFGIPSQPAIVPSLKRRCRGNGVRERNPCGGGRRLVAFRFHRAQRLPCRHPAPDPWSCRPFGAPRSVPRRGTAGILATLALRYNAAHEQRILACRGRDLALRPVQIADRDPAGGRGLAGHPGYADIGLAGILVTRFALARLDRAMRVFFSRVQPGKEPGFPRFRARNRYHSFSVDDPNAARSAIRIFDVSHRGEVRMRGLPRMRSAIRRALPPITRLRGFHVVRKARRVEPCSGGSCRRSVPERLVGLDAGLRTFATLSDGRSLERRPSSAVRSAIRRKQRAESCSRRGPRSRGKKKAALVRTHERAAEAGRHEQHRLTDRIIRTCDFTAAEALKIRILLRRGPGKRYLNRAIAEQD